MSGQLSPRELQAIPCVLVWSLIEILESHVLPMLPINYQECYELLMSAASKT